MKRLVVCMKWGSLYGSEYVNLLSRAVLSNLPEEHEFMCLTDNTDGIDARVKCEPLPELPIDSSYWKKGGWPKLAVFQPGFLPDGYRVLFVDLDTIITGNISAMFQTGSAVTMVKEWKRLMDYINPFRAQKQLSSVFAFDSGREERIYETFLENPAQAREKYRVEQYFLAAHASALNTWPDDWVVSFKRHLLPPRLGIRKGSDVSAPPEAAKMLLFHGEPRPIDVVQDGVWGKQLRYGRGSVPYLLDYWRRHGVEPSKTLSEKSV